MTTFNTRKYYVHSTEAEALKFITEKTKEYERTFALIVFNKVSPFVVDYTLRFNYTTLPNTNRVESLTTLGLSDDYQRYWTSGFMSLQRSVDEFIFNISGASVASSDQNAASNYIYSIFFEIKL